MLEESRKEAAGLRGELMAQRRTAEERERELGEELRQWRERAEGLQEALERERLRAQQDRFIADKTSSV